MSEKTPDNFGYGDMTADYRKRYKQMLEEHNSKTNKKKNKKNESAMERITRILYGGNKWVYTKTFIKNVKG